jgi:hypothetical protein
MVPDYYLHLLLDISALTLKLIIILIPGAISTLLFDSLTTHKEWTPFKFIVNCILMGIIAYLLLQGAEPKRRKWRRKYIISLLTKGKPGATSREAIKAPLVRKNQKVCRQTKSIQPRPHRRRLLLRIAENRYELINQTIPGQPARLHNLGVTGL